MPKGNPRQQWLKALFASAAEGNLSDFASKARMDYTGLNLMVNGKRPISEKTVIKIVNRLKVPPPPDFALPGQKPQEEAKPPASRDEALIQRMADTIDRQTTLIVTMMGQFNQSAATEKEILEGLRRLEKRVADREISDDKRREAQ